MKQKMKSYLLYLAYGIALSLVIGITLNVVGIISFHPVKPFNKPKETAISNGIQMPGRWNKILSSSLSTQQKREIDKLRSLGYLGGSQPAREKAGVTIYNKIKSFSSLNLVVSGHAPEAFLMDMSGRTLHTWKYDLFHVWPNYKPVIADEHGEYHTFWRRAHLFPNGDILAIFERIGLIKLDKQSNLLWARQNNAHHDLDIADNGDIYVLTGEAHINPKFNSRKPIWEDYISVLNSNGKELKRVSVLGALQNSKFASVLQRVKPEGDILHTNTIELIRDLPHNLKSPFIKGTIILSMRSLDLVCAVDLEKQTVYWAESNLCHRQHQPTLLDNGNLLIFDNQRTTITSAIIELEPISRSIVWSYVGARDGDLYTELCGSSQRLPNGNTLITESEAGRAFEVTPDKTTVWEYVNPHRAGKENEFIATLFEVVRLRNNFPIEWSDQQ